MDEPLMNKTFYREDQLQLLEDTKRLNTQMQLMQNKYMSDDTIVPVMRMNLQNVAQTMGMLCSSFIMGVEQLESRESGPEPSQPNQS